MRKMKKITFVIVACITIILRAQPYYTIYPHFSELSGMEDFKANTNLFYRIKSHTVDGNSWNVSNNIYNLNPAEVSDTLLFIDQSINSTELGNNIQFPSTFDFWNNDPRKYIVAKVYSGFCVDNNLYNYKLENLFPSGIIPLTYVSTYKNNDTAFIFVAGDKIIKYKGRDNNDRFLYDTLGDFKAISHSPFNQNVFFAVENGNLYKTNDEGRTKYLVDTTFESEYQQSPLFKSIVYDKNENFIYRTVNNWGVYKLMISANKGEPMSWSKMFSSTDKLFISADKEVPGLIYLASGRNIYQSYDYANFFLLKTFDRIVRGIYKQPGVDRLYAATSNKIYEMSGDCTTVILTMPFDKDLLKYDPIQTGNKWIYKGETADNGFPKNSYLKIKEVVKDTILNDKLCKQIRLTTIYNSGSSITDYQYERIDTNTGLITFIDDGHEFVADDLNMIEKDTVDFSRYYPGEFTVFNSSSEYTGFSTSFPQRTYYTKAGFEDRTYSLVKNIGCVYYYRWYSEGFTVTESLKACIINGTVYGDTTTVGINDKTSVPERYSLLQNYPNPFNPVTNIEYSIAVSGKVIIRIYDLLGNLIAEPVNEIKNAGSYKVQFNGTELASGVYFYKLQSGNYSAVKKLILIK